MITSEEKEGREGTEVGYEKYKLVCIKWLEMQKSKMAVWGGLTNSFEKKRSEKQRRKGKIYPSECRIPKNSQERQESLPQLSLQRNRGKQ